MGTNIKFSIIVVDTASHSASFVPLVQLPSLGSAHSQSIRFDDFVKYFYYNLLELYCYFNSYATFHLLLSEIRAGSETVSRSACTTVSWVRLPVSPFPFALYF